MHVDYIRHNLMSTLPFDNKYLRIPPEQIPEMFASNPVS